MIRYIDSGAAGETDCLGVWLDEKLVDGLRAFRGQFGYYDGRALAKYLPVLRACVESGGTFRLAVGTNPGDPPTTADLRSLLTLVQAAPEQASLSVVGYFNALFHPKTLHIVQADGTACAAVGSANLTAKGLGHNLEAGVVIESHDATDAVLTQIAAAIDRWATCTESGVYQVASEDDVERLEEAGLAVSPARRRQLRRAQRTATTSTGRGTRRVGWRPPAATGPDEPAEVEEAGEGQFEVEPAPAGPPRQGPIVARWCKRLSSSDALQTTGDTNPTGKLRLGKAKHHIDKNTFFREELFGNAAWVETTRKGRSVEEAHVEFQVTRDGVYVGPMTLLVDFAEHRIAGQNNVPTVLAWGRDLSEWLRGNPHTGSWVLLERDAAGVHWLTIQGQTPDWAPEATRNAGPAV